MIDRAALETVASKQHDLMKAPSGLSMILHLVSGEKYAVNSIDEYLESSCVVLVYPQEALSAQDLGKAIPKNSEGDLIFDRLVLPYQAILYLTMTAREPEKRSAIGYKFKG